MQPTGTRLWRLAYRFDGKQKLLALGSYPLISLGEARQARVFRSRAAPCQVR
ncbi:Arm DNA-binding domain-containing protein [Mesorhizobium montanum]|uniref:Arm DNA-binding domain-containing protein n=1 Tax=Mesorhizobium montanum TaxID=3072323 RepID=UPI003D31DD27